MKKPYSFNNPLYLITDTEIAGISHSEIAGHAVRAGVGAIQLREKVMSKKDIFLEALRIRKMTVKQGVTFIVNDYVDIALAAGADGVHLGQEDMPVKEARKVLGKGKIIGVSTHNLREAKKAMNDGADYIGFGPVYKTATKDAGEAKGTGTLRKARRHVKIPIVAIGGITWENVNEVLSAGADSCAVVSGILSGDIRENVKEYFKAVRTCCPHLFPLGLF